MKAQKAKMKENEGQKGQETQLRPKRPKEKGKAIKAQKAKMKGNEGPKGQNERKFPLNRNGQILPYQGQKWTKKLKKRAFPGTEM